MPGDLNHKPSTVLRQALHDLGAGINPSELTPDQLLDNDSWPISDGLEMGSPDNTITLKDVPGRDWGREQWGERQEMDGIQIRVRASDQKTGFLKAHSLGQLLDRQLLATHVIVDPAGTPTEYVINTFIRGASINDLGKMTDSSRYVFTMNGVISIRKL